MQILLRKLGSAIATIATCAMCVVPGCASMGGGGMKGMFSDAPVTTRDATG